MNNISEVNQSILVPSRKQKLLSEQLPDSIDFNFCCVDQVSQREIMIDNKNGFGVQFRIEESSFEFSPKSGQINGRQSQKILVSYTPKEAKVIVSSAVFHFSNEPSRVMKLSVIGKIPYMTMNRSKIDFDYLLVGQKVSEDVIMKNQSQVECVFRINKRQEDNLNDNSFMTDVTQGCIPPKSTFLIRVVYQPKVVNMISSQHFQIECIGGNSQTLQVSGIGQSYLTYLSTNSLNFGEIKQGQRSNKILSLYNDSDSSTKFEFFNQQGNVFSLNRNHGVIEPKSQTRIIVYFNPRATVSYYQRVYCIVRNHSLLHIDLMGSCYDLLVRPLAIVQRHIDLFRTRVIQGRITKLDIKYLENAMVNYMGTNLSHTQNFKTSNFNNQLQQQIQQEDKSNNSLYNDTFQEKTQFTNQLALHKELFQEQKSEHRIIYLSDDFIDFGFSGQNQTSSCRDIEIYNNLSCQMTILWTIHDKNQDGNIIDQIFRVFPQQATLKPLSSCKFGIQFSPDKSSQYYHQDVQYFAIKNISSLQNKKIEDLKMSIVNNGYTKFNNISRTSRKINSLNINNSQILVDEQIPSLSGYIKCIGHSFDQDYQTFIPIVELQPSKNVMFQSCTVDHIVYQTVELINKTDTPTYFQFSPDMNKTFSIYPLQGLVQGKSFKILTIQFQPKETRMYQCQLTCSLNHNSSNRLIINCNGICGSPSLSIENDGKVYFPPAYAGLYSTQKVSLQNQSRVPVEVRLDISDKYQQEVHLNPKQLKLKPHESSQVEIAFIPLQKKKYKIQIPIKIYNIVDISQQQVGYFMPGSGSEYQVKKIEQNNQNISDQVVQEYSLTIFGQGSDGTLKMHPQVIDFNIVKVNFNKKQYVTLENNSDCTFWVELQLRQNMKNGQSSEENQSVVEECFQLDFQQGVIAAHSKVDIGITFSPTQVVDIQLDLECWAKERPMKGVFGMSQTFKKLVVQKCKVNIRGSGSYPNLKIVDVRNDSVSVATLWENFCINQINNNLSQNLNNDEKQFLQIETLNFQEAQSVMKRLQAYQWNFGYLPLNQITKPRKIVITIQNKGGTELDWNFKLPSDSQIEVEPWADPGEPSLEEAFEKVIIEKKIFDIIPRSGHLEPQKSADIELIYNPKNFSDDVNNFSESEQHFLQVILQIVNGKPLLIHLTGNTLAPNKGKIAVKKNHYQLPDMPIGQLLPVSFPIEITNVGCININYKVEVKEILEKGQKVQSQFNIFDIKKDVDNIPQGQKQYIYCLFRPLEPKNYVFELTIHVYDNGNKIDQQLIRVEGLGYFNNPPKQIQTKVQEIPSARSKYSSIGSNVFFSIEEIDFGELESGKSEHRILLLYNVSKTNRFSFKFNQTGLVCMDDLLLDPMNGTVEPEQFIEIKLSLISKTVPAVYEGEIECKIQWEAVKNNDVSNDSSVQNVFEQKQLLEKETLFLRIKKKSKLQNQSTSIPYEHTKNENNENENIFEILMKSAVRDILNDPELDQILDRVDNQPIQLFNQFDNQQTVDITQIQNHEQRDDNYKNRLLNFKDDYTNLFMNQEFTVLVDSVMENTFFNIIQETTRKEADLLKISNTYLTPNR